MLCNLERGENSGLFLNRDVVGFNLKNWNFIICGTLMVSLSLSLNCGVVGLNLGSKNPVILVDYNFGVIVGAMQARLEEVAKGEMGTPLFDPTRCVRESWILFSPGWRHLSPCCHRIGGAEEARFHSAPTSGGECGTAAVSLTSFPPTRPSPPLLRPGLY